MTTVRTRNKNYIQPTQSEMKEMAEKVKLKSYSTSLVEDICNLSDGGEYIENQRMKSLIIENLNFNDITQDKYDYYFYEKRAIRDEDRNNIKDFQQALDIIVEDKLNYHNNVQDFLRELNIDNLIGDSPLEKAMNLLKLLSTQEGGSSKGDSMMLPIFNEQKPEELAQKINETMETLESLDDIESELLEESKKSSLEIACDMMKGKNIMLKIKRQLDKLAKLKTSKSLKFIPDVDGNEIRYRGMKELSEMDKMNPIEFVYPTKYRNLRMVTGEAQVRERCHREEKKMLLYIICDYSGSMSEDNRFWKAGGVLMNRLKAVIEGDAELFFAFFDDELSSEYKAETKEDAVKLMGEIQEQNFSGGSTSIASCVKTAIKRINKKLEKNSSLTKPELILVTDGDDGTTSLKSEHLGDIRLHTFIVGGNNQHIIDLANKSGGVGITIE